MFGRGPSGTIKGRGVTPASSFLSFAKAARAQDLIAMEWDGDADDYLLRVPD